MRILVVIPAFNEQDNISPLLSKLKELKMPNLDVLVINDKSTDKTYDICKNEQVYTVDLPCNLGIGGAVQTGYKYAKNFGYDIAIQIDGDGQHDPKYINSLIQPIIDGKADMVIGSRYITKMGFQSTSIRRLGIKYFSQLIYFIIKQKITDPTSGFRACNSKVIELFSNSYPSDFPEPESIVFLKRNRCEVIEVSVIMKEREHGKSSINAVKSIYYAIKVSLAIVFDAMRGKVEA